MAELIDKLNTILADERACVHALHRAETQCDNLAQHELIGRVIGACIDSCVALENTVCALGGVPANVPSARFRQNPPDESLAGRLKVIKSVQQHIIAQIDALLIEPDLKSYSELLQAIRQFHADGIRWLMEALI